MEQIIEELFRGRPAVLAALGLGLGIAFEPVCGFSFAVGLALLVAVFSFVWRRKGFAVLWLFALFCLVGSALIHEDVETYSNTPLTRIASLKLAKVILTGTIIETEETNFDYLWTFHADSIGIPREQEIPANGNVLLRLPKAGYSNAPLPESGSMLRVYSTLEPFHRPTNPHEFGSDLKQQAATHTEAVGFVHSRFDYTIVHTAQPSILSELSTLLSSIHAELLGLLDRSIEQPDARGFVEAVVLGDRSNMDKETLNDFTTAGVAHILAVSGFNVAIVSLVVAQLLRIFGLHWHRTRIGITMATILLYSAIVGFQPSVVRALLMIELYLIATLLERKPDPLNIVMSAAAINLLLRPQDLFDVGFQLSYAGVLGMVLLAPKILWLFGLKNEDDLSSRHVPTPGKKRIRELGTATALSLGASIASYPVIVAHFYRISFIGLLANLPLIPLSAIITAFGFLLLPLTALSGWVGHLYGDVTTYMSDLLLFLTHFSAHVPAAAHAAASPSSLLFVSLFLSVLFCFRSKTRLQFVGRMTIAFAGFFVLWSLHVPLSNSVLDPNAGKLQVLFFDVGQGDCIFLHTPNDKSYFIDFGRLERNGTANIERTAIPFLRAENITTIDAGFITHMHVDHYGGAPSLLQHCSVALLFSSGERVPSQTARALDSIATIQHVARRILACGDTLHLDSDVTLYVLYPNRNARIMDDRSPKDIHAGMLVAKVIYRNTSFLFLGDVERSEEEALRSTYGSFLRSNVVKVAHHGSSTSSSPGFIAATHPNFAVISVGEHNSFGHPSPAIVKRWMTNGATVFRTDKDGALLFTSDGNQVERNEW